MRAVMLPAVFAAILLQATVSLAACPDPRSKNCPVLNLVPQNWENVVTDAPGAAAARPIPAADSRRPYTGPTIGLSPTVHQTPTVGYRWAID